MEDVLSHTKGEMTGAREKRRDKKLTRQRIRDTIQLNPRRKKRERERDRERERERERKMKKKEIQKRCRKNRLKISVTWQVVLLGPWRCLCHSVAWIPRFPRLLASLLCLRDAVISRPPTSLSC